MTNGEQQWQRPQDTRNEPLPVPQSHHGPSKPDELAVASTSGGIAGAPTPGPSKPARGVKRPATGEEGALMGAILNLEGLRGAMEEGEGWGKPTANERWRNCMNGCCKVTIRQIHHRGTSGKPGHRTSLLPPQLG